MTEQEKGTPWELLPMIMMSALIGVLVLLTSNILVYGVYLFKKAATPELTFKVFVKSVNILDTTLVGLTSIGGTIVALLLIFYFVKRRQGITASDYLGLKIPKFREFAFWFLILFLFMMANGVISQYAGQFQESSKFTVNLVTKSDNILLILLAVAVAAPLLEEFMMRGFIFETLLHAKMNDVLAVLLVALVSYLLVSSLIDIWTTPLWLINSVAVLCVAGAVLYGLFILHRRYPSDMAFGTVGTLLLTSVSWSLLHSQYGWYNLVVIACLGILFGIAKIRTGSLFIPIFLHASQNAIAVLAVFAYASKSAAGAG